MLNTGQEPLTPRGQGGFFRRVAGRRFGVAAGAAILASVLGTLPGSAEESPSSLEGFASAYGFDMTTFNPSIPLGLTIQAAGPTAQAQLTGLASDGFAAFPYFGDVVTNAPDLISSMTPGGLPVPRYPLYVSSSLGSDRGSADAPGVTLRSESSPSRVAASAIGGTAAVGLTAEASVVREDGKIVSQAQSALDLAEIGGVLSVTGMASDAQVKLQSGGKIVRSSSLSLGRIRAPGLKLTIPEQSPGPLGGTTIAEPDIGFIDGQFVLNLPIFGNQRFALPADVVLTAFKERGIDIKLTPAQETESGIVGAALSITTTLPTLPANPYINGETLITFAFGRSTAAVSGSGAFTKPDANVSVGASPSGEVGLGAVMPVPSFEAALGAGPAATRGTGTGTGTGPGSAAVATSTARPLASADHIYLVLIALGVIGTGAGQLLRLVGVRPWKS